MLNIFKGFTLLRLYKRIVLYDLMNWQIHCDRFVNYSKVVTIIYSILYMWRCYKTFMHCALACCLLSLGLAIRYYREDIKMWTRYNVDVTRKNLKAVVYLYIVKYQKHINFPNRKTILVQFTFKISYSSFYRYTWIICKEYRVIIFLRRLKYIFNYVSHDVSYKNFIALFVVRLNLVWIFNEAVFKVVP